MVKLHFNSRIGHLSTWFVLSLMPVTGILEGGVMRIWGISSNLPLGIP